MVCVSGGWWNDVNNKDRCDFWHQVAFDQHIACLFLTTL